MAKLTGHAKDRLKERFGFEENQIQIIGNKISTTGQYRLIRKEPEREIREVRHNGVEMQAVLKNNFIVSVLPPTFVSDDAAREVENLREECRELKKELQSKSDRVESYETKLYESSFLDCMIYIIKKRSKYKKKMVGCRYA